jgi:hypothetical protein
LKAIPGVGFRLVSPAVVVVVDVGVDDVGTADDGVVEHELKYKKCHLGDCYSFYYIEIYFY